MWHACHGHSLDHVAASRHRRSGRRRVRWRYRSSITVSSEYRTPWTYSSRSKYRSTSNTASHSFDATFRPDGIQHWRNVCCFGRNSHSWSCYWKENCMGSRWICFQTVWQSFTKKDSLKFALFLVFRWTSIYPIYIDAKRPYSNSERRIAREKSIWWPLSIDIVDACSQLRLKTLHEVWLSKMLRKRTD